MIDRFEIIGHDSSFCCVDSRRTRIGQVLPAAGERFRFTYEYDFFVVRALDYGGLVFEDVRVPI